MQRGAHFFLRRSAPMQRGVRFWAQRIRGLSGSGLSGSGLSGSGLCGSGLSGSGLSGSGLSGSGLSGSAWGSVARGAFGFVALRFVMPVLTDFFRPTYEQRKQLGMQKHCSTKLFVPN